MLFLSCLGLYNFGSDNFFQLLQGIPGGMGVLPHDKVIAINEPKTSLDVSGRGRKAKGGEN